MTQDDSPLDPLADPLADSVSMDWLERLRRAERQAARAALSSYFVHKLGTPLNVLLGRANMILSADGISESVKKNAQALVNTVQQMVADVQGLADEERSVGLQPEETDVRELVQQALRMFEPLARRRDIEIAQSDGQPARTVVDPLRAQLLITSKMGELLEGRSGRLRVDVGVERLEHPDDLRCAPGDYVAVRLSREGRDDGGRQERLIHEEREDVHVARMLGGFVTRDGDSWALFWPRRG